ncbi:MAG: SBBP repeat-containing protein [Phycisphaerae bacterium]|nr:SBBP repeat-containing protein [Phycisphaerae bacterium]
MRSYRLFLQFGITVLFSTLAQAGPPMQQWVASYNGPGNHHDEATALAIDSTGNIYVTGWGYGVDTCEDYATIKYDENGNQLWVRRYDGPADECSWDEAEAVTIDDSGNVYVTGGSHGIDTYEDYATVKYDANGNQLWVRRYNGSGNGYDRAIALAVDNSGNIYVAGDSDAADRYTDCITIKYDTNGNQLWMRCYDGPGARGSDDHVMDMAVDDFGNVYVTGYRCEQYEPSTPDYTTIKYDSNGNQLWVRCYNGPGNSGDRATSLAVDNFGNVYVTGESYGGSESYTDYATIKYDSNGNELWVKRYNGPNDQDFATALALDDFGDVYVTGASWEDEGDRYDCATIKYDANGNQLWVARYGRGSYDYDVPTAIVVNNKQSIYISGYSDYYYTDLHSLISIKYNTEGVLQWATCYNGQDVSQTTVDMVIDNSGNIYLSGHSYDDYVTIKYLDPRIEPNIVVEDFESYVNSSALRQEWADKINPEGLLKGTAEVQLMQNPEIANGMQSIKVKYNNSSTPHVSETWRFFNPPADWTETGVKILALYFYGDSGNDANEQMYMIIEDTNANKAVVLYDGNPNDLKNETWQFWSIELHDFENGGVNLADVNKLTIGFGDGNEPLGSGSGWVYFDDVGLYVPRCLDEPIADITGDCVVDFEDLKLLAFHWLEQEGNPVGDIYEDSKVDLKDYTVMAYMWLEEGERGILP